MRGGRGVVGAANGHRAGGGATHPVCAYRVGHAVCNGAGPRSPPRRRTSSDIGSGWRVWSICFQNKYGIVNVHVHAIADVCSYTRSLQTDLDCRGGGGGGECE